jgi:Protein of unknown function (DUF1761)
MFANVNWISVVVAALATFVIGGLWYSPVLFLKPWQRAMNVTADQPRHPVKTFGLAYVFSVLSCAATERQRRRWLEARAVSRCRICCGELWRQLSIRES